MENISTEYSIIGSRLFRIDNECYIIYMGKPDHMYRPFIRIGNSLDLPPQIIPHIGSVILSEHLTGNCFIESACLDPYAEKSTNYVGDHSLVDSISKFLDSEKISEIPLNFNVDGNNNEGSNVVFYTNGNLQVVLNGHTIFDLQEREESDLHRIQYISRLEQYISQTENSWTENDFMSKGFIILNGGIPAVFEGGIVQPIGNTRIENIVQTMVPPSVVRRFAGNLRTDTVLNLSKWHKLLNNSIEFNVSEHSNEQSSKFITYLEESGVPVQIISQDREEVVNLRENENNISVHSSINVLNEVPSVRIESIQIPEGDSWSLIHPPLIHGIPYTFSINSNIQNAPDLQTNLETFMEESGRVIIEEVNDSSNIKVIINDISQSESLDHYTKTALFMWIWNRINKSQEIDESSAKEITHIIQNNSHPIPAQAEIVRLKEGWTVFFSVKSGVTKQVVHSWAETHSRIQEAANLPLNLYLSERNRLIESLENLFKTPEPPTQVIDTPEVESHIDNTAVITHDSSNKSVQDSTESIEPSNSKQMQDTTKKRKFSPLALIIPILILAIAIPLIIFVPRITNNPLSNDRTAENSSSSEIDSRENDTSETNSAESDSSGTASAETNPRAADTSETNSSESDLSETDSRTTDSSGTDSGTSDSSETNSVEPDSSENANNTNSNVANQPDRSSNNAINWTEIEILLVANWISFNNGYELLGIETLRERDPDWIYPGNSFRLPNRNTYVVEEGDSIWFIATNFLNISYAESGVSEQVYRELLQNIDLNRNILF